MPLNQLFILGEPHGRRRSLLAVTLVELLCVIAIIAILLSMLLPTVTKTYIRAKDWADEQEAPQVAQMLRHEARGYCRANPRFQFTSKADFESKCKFAPKARDWVEASATEFLAFDYLTPTNQTVLTVHIGSKRRITYTFTTADLSRPSETP